MPPLPSEIKMLIDNLTAQVQQLQSSNDQIHIFVQSEVEKARIIAESLSNKAKIEINERIDQVKDDTKELHREIKEIKDVTLVEIRNSLMKNQNDNYSRVIEANKTTIKVQGAILLTVFAAFVSFVFTYFHH